jgi:hypothetical protein
VKGPDLVPIVTVSCFSQAGYVSGDGGQRRKTQNCITTVYAPHAPLQCAVFFRTVWSKIQNFGCVVLASKTVYTSGHIPQLMVMKLADDLFCSLLTFVNNLQFVLVNYVAFVFSI